LANDHPEFRLSFRRAVIAASILLWTSSAWSLQEGQHRDTIAVREADSVRADGGAIRLISALGSLKRQIDSSSALHSSRFVWRDASQAGELLWIIPGYFLRELGEPGQPIQLNANGIDGRGISIQLDGRPLTDPVTGAYDLNEIPLEYVDQMESTTDAQSVFYGSNSAGPTLNFVTHQYNNVRPLTKLRYLQGPFEQILSDGIFAQNVARGVNVMIGFRRLATDGRFPNSKYDSWNMRSRVRYNHSDRLNVWISDIYTRSTTGFNGGIDIEQSPSVFNEVTAAVRSRDASQTVSRRDVTLGGLGRLFSDSSSTTHARFFYSTIDREYRQRDSSQIVHLDIVSSWGATFVQQFPLGPAMLSVGGDIDRRQIGQSDRFGTSSETLLALKGRGEYFPHEAVKTSAFLRHEGLRGQRATSLGVEANLALRDWLGLRLGISKGNRFPSVQEYYWPRDGAPALLQQRERPGVESHTFREIELHSALDSTLSIRVSGFQREIPEAITFETLETPGHLPTATLVTLHDVKIQGFLSSFVLRTWGFEVSGAFTYTDYKHAGTAASIFPKYVFRGEFAYRDRLFEDALDGRLGIRFTAVSSQMGLEFIPQNLVFALQSDARLGSFSKVDLYAILKLGDAHVLVAWENPFDIDYVLTPTYPMPGSSFKIGVNWIFID